MSMMIRLIILTLFILSFQVNTGQTATYRLVTAPFVPFTNPDHPKGGFLVEVARQAFAKSGRTLEVSFHPWARAMKEAETGRYDGLLSAFYNKERGEIFHFSAPLNTTKMVFVGLRKNFTVTRYDNLQDLYDYKIAVGRKWAYSEEFEQNQRIEKQIVNDEPNGIHLLYNGRVDLFAVNIDQFLHTISKMDKYDARQSIILSPSISTNNQHIAASRALAGTPQMLADFNTGLAALKASGEYQKIRQDFFGF
ncbi:transporter substrate-binding domain-containing protein [Terasakiella sp. A23]|uniref:substrate-binding periplasmic protein n=1 Tax=Terasakiella sp. FCG-A23 TaxID=3080561 RepID=UPI002954C311|nr:transporter substrate-binding domain-containing protein [Terasakiella sp. A23]MDV7340412.1 transporter substrate-binding domain-containing protein [Terasakiella sp. A23]